MGKMESVQILLPPNKNVYSRGGCGYHSAGGIVVKVVDGEHVVEALI